MDQPYTFIDRGALARAEAGIPPSAMMEQAKREPSLIGRRNFSATPLAATQTARAREEARVRAAEAKLKSWISSSDDGEAPAQDYTMRMNLAVGAIVSGRAKDAYSAHRIFNVSFIELQRAVSASHRTRVTGRATKT